MDNLFPPGRGTFGGGSLGHPGNGQHATANHSDLGSQCRRCPMDRCIVPAGAGGHASRLLHAQPQLDPLQPASLPVLATLRAGFWRHSGTLNCWLRVVNRCGFTFIRPPNDSLSPRSFYKGGCQEKYLPIELKPSEISASSPRPSRLADSL